MEASSLQRVHEALGARLGEIAGRPVPRHYGDPAGEYAAARNHAAVVDRADRALVRLYGRDPLRMIQGLVSNDVVRAPEGQGVYAAMLTPKGKMIADLRVLRRPQGDVLLELDAGALPGVLEHLRKYVPPLFARFEDVTGQLGVVGVYGPAARRVVGAALGAELPDGMPEDAYVLVAWPREQGGGDSAAGGASEAGRSRGEVDAGEPPGQAATASGGEGSDGADREVLVLRTLYAGVDGYDVVAPRDRIEAVWRALVDAGARPAGHGTLEVLRIEAGRPRWGAELDETVIPLEAGLGDRAISQTKGCYTGQEVIVRILHRGHVNWHLRGLLLGEAAAPARGTVLVRPGEAKPVGRVTSACSSPALGQTIGLGYVRREVEPPAELRLGGPDGAPVRVVALPFPEPERKDRAV
ncbi:MAG TPA: glycine cleavage T C-terminal barrel domain-containing protein [Longimicrobiales bacterium]